MTLARQLAIVALLLFITALVGQPTLDPNGAVLLAQDDASQAAAIFDAPGDFRLNGQVGGSISIHLEVGDDGRLRVRLPQAATVIESSGFDLTQTADIAWLVASGTDTTVRRGPNGHGFSLETLVLKLSPSAWMVRGHGAAPLE